MQLRHADIGISRTACTAQSVLENTSGQTKSSFHRSIFCGQLRNLSNKPHPAFRNKSTRCGLRKVAPSGVRQDSNFYFTRR